MNPARRRAAHALVYLLFIAGGGAIGFLVAPSVPAPQERCFTIRAYKYGYDPAILHVNRGDTVRLRFASEDVMHGFYLEAHDIDVAIVPMRSAVVLRRPSRPGQREDVDEVVFKAEREGKFRYRCSQTCGFLHPFMLGELVVGPNRLFPVGLGLVGGLLLGAFSLALCTGGRP